jgi:hypothetical protein
MNVAAVLDRLESQGVTITVTGDQVKLEPGSRVPSHLVEQLKHHKKEVVAFLRGRHTQSANPPVGDDSRGLPAHICDGFPKAQVEMATAINDKFGITDRDHRRYNVLVWVLGFYQDRGENHGEWYEALEQEQQRLRGILESRDIG